MAKIFRFRVEKPVEEVMDKISSVCTGAGLRMNRQINSGSIDGMGASASFEILQRSAALIVNKIPIFLSWGRVEKEIDKHAADFGLVYTGKENA